MKVATYIRCSTRGQGDDDRYGLPKQRADIEVFVGLEGHEVVASFEDIGFSGATAARPGLAEMLEAEGFDAIVVPCWDRLARNPNLDGYLRYSLKKRGIVVLSATQSNAVDPTSELTQVILAAVAGYERHLISQRLAGARRLKAAQGGYAHGKPKFGTSSGGGVLIENATETGAIAAMVSLRALGLTIREIVDKLNGEPAYATRTGKKWGPSSVHRILARATQTPRPDRSVFKAISESAYELRL